LELSWLDGLPLNSRSLRSAIRSLSFVQVPFLPVR
jgi:hypothetical protein